MSQALASLGQIFTAPAAGAAGSSPLWAKLALGGMTGLGEVGNILAAKQRQDQLNAVNRQMGAITNLTPQQLSAKVAAATQPLSLGLTENVGNQVQAAMAERGLAQAPGIFAATESQALAPYQQQEQQMALSEILNQMMIPADYARTAGEFLPQQTNLSPLVSALLASLGKGGSTSPLSTSASSVYASPGQNQGAWSEEPPNIQNPEWGDVPSGLTLPNVVPAYGGT